MKTLLYDILRAQPVGKSKYHGGGETTKKIFKVLVEKYVENINIIVFYNKEKFIDDWLKGLIDQYNIKMYDIKKHEDIVKIFACEKIDTFYSCLPYSYNRNLIPSDVVFIGTVHGLRLLEMPADKFAYLYTSGFSSIKERIKLLILKYWRKKRLKDYRVLIRSLDKIITDSFHSCYSIQYYYPEFKNKDIYVLYPPLKEVETPLKASHLIQKPYILLLGGNRWEKNCYREILAIESLLKNGYLENYKIVIIGEINYKIKKKISDISKYLIFDYAEPEDLETLTGIPVSRIRSAMRSSSSRVAFCKSWSGVSRSMV